MTFAHLKSTIPLAECVELAKRWQADGVVLGFRPDLARNEIALDKALDAVRSKKRRNVA